MKKTKQLTIAGAVEAMLQHRAVYGVVSLEPGNVFVSDLEEYEMFFEYEEVEPEPKEKPVTEMVEKAAKPAKQKEPTAPKKKSGRPKKEDPEKAKSNIPDGINVDRIIELHKQGWSRERIANNCDCSVNDVITVLREKGVIDVVPAA